MKRYIHYLSLTLLATNFLCIRGQEETKTETKATLSGFVILSLLGKVKIIASEDVKLVEEVGKYLVDKGVTLEKAPD
jgi:hypothetical protein